MTCDLDEEAACGLGRSDLSVLGCSWVFKSPVGRKKQDMCVGLLMAMREIKICVGQVVVVGEEGVCVWGCSWREKKGYVC